MPIARIFRSSLTATGVIIHLSQSSVVQSITVQRTLAHGVHGRYRRTRQRSQSAKVQVTIEAVKKYSNRGPLLASFHTWCSTIYFASAIPGRSTEKLVTASCVYGLTTRLRAFKEFASGGHLLKNCHSVLQVGRVLRRIREEEAPKKSQIHHRTLYGYDMQETKDISSLKHGLLCKAYVPGA